MREQMPDLAQNEWAARRPCLLEPIDLCSSQPPKHPLGFGQKPDKQHVLDAQYRNNRL
jgi:hypothetical protein